MARAGVITSRALDAAVAAARPGVTTAEVNAAFERTMLELGGVQTSYRNDSSSVVSPLYTMKPRVYLNDHNEPRPLDDLGMKQPDFQKCQVLGIRY